jgi:TonB family protein
MSRLKPITGKTAIVSLLSLLMCAAGLIAQAHEESGPFIIEATAIERAIAGAQSNKSSRVGKRRRVARRSRLARRRSIAKPSPAIITAAKRRSAQPVLFGTINDETALAGKASPAYKPKSPVSGGVLNSKATSLPRPPYPPIARAARASGTVVVQILVDEEGNVVDARAASGHPLLQNAATAAAWQAKFIPTRLAGQPVKVTGVITYNFVLD